MKRPFVTEADVFGEVAAPSPMEIYHENSKLGPFSVREFAKIQHVNESVAIQDRITGARAGIEGASVIDIASSDRKDTQFSSLLKRRRSAKKFSQSPIQKTDLAYLLECANGITGSADSSGFSQFRLRAAPSPGGLFPIDIYCVVISVDEVPPGVYWYDPESNHLVTVKIGEFRGEILAGSYLGERGGGLAVFVSLVGVIPRIYFKYDERSYRFVLLESGHVAQNVLLAAEDRNLGAIPVGGFNDNLINSIIGVDGVSEFAVYNIAIGMRPTI